MYMLANEENLEGIAAFIFLNIKLLKEMPPA